MATCATVYSEASLSRAANFARVHREDVAASLFVALKSAQEGMERGKRTLAQAEAEGRQDVERAQALDEAAEALGAAQHAADRAYSEAESQFAAIETLRRIWVQQFREDSEGVHWRASEDLPPAW